MMNLTVILVTPMSLEFSKFCLFLMNFRNFFAKILQLFVKILLFHIIFFAKKAKIISSFASKQNAKMKRNGREIFIREKCEIFAKRFFLFPGNPKISVFYIFD